MSVRNGGAAEYGVWHGPRTEYAPIPMAMIEGREFAHATVRLYGYFIGVVTRPVSTNPSGRWILRKRDAMRKCGIGEEGWARAVHELTDAGLYFGESTTRERGSRELRNGVEVAVGGQKGYVHHVYSIEAPRERQYPQPPPGEPGGGQPAGGEAPTLRLREYAFLRKQKQQHARAQAKNVYPKAAAAIQSGKKGRRRPSGIVTWDPGDPEYAEQVEKKFAPEIVAAAVAAVSARKNSRGNPKSPDPFSVESEARRILRERANREEAQVKRDRHQQALAAAKKTTLRLDPNAFEAALERAGPYRDDILHAAYLAHGSPSSFVPLAVWGLGEVDVDAIRASIPDRALDSP